MSDTEERKHGVEGYVSDNREHGIVSDNERRAEASYSAKHARDRYSEAEERKRRTYSEGKTAHNQDTIKICIVRPYGGHQNVFLGGAEQRDTGALKGTYRLPCQLFETKEKMIP